MKTLTIVLALAGAPVAQQAAAPEDQGVVDATRGAIERAMNDPEFLVIDEPIGGGTTWVAGRDYRASFVAGGWTFCGRPAPGATVVRPVAFRLAGVAVGATTLDLAPASAPPVRHDRRFEYTHGAVVEAVDVSPRGAEQTFTFATLPQRGELRIDVAVETTLAGETGAGGLVFRGPFDEIRYSAAVAIDARGERVAAPTELRDGRIVIRVPAPFVERAVLPLVVDPLVSTIQVFGVQVMDPDVAWDESAQVWAVVFASPFAAPGQLLYGSNCFVQRVTAGVPMALVGSVVPIDVGLGEDWQRPRIASLDGWNRFMVVAQVQTWFGSPFGIHRVRGRILANDATPATNAFDVQSGTVTGDYHPDIGGDPLPSPAGFTVVWEHDNGSNHDVWARQVDANGTLLGAGPTVIQASSLHESWPTISKSCGGGPRASQRFLIAWQQPRPMFPFDENVHGAMLTWDGQLVQVGFGTTFAIDTSTNNDVLPQPSSPTLPTSTGQRAMLVAYERTNVNGGDIAMTCVDQSGNVLATANLDVLANDPWLPWPQARPSVDCDGTRFVVAHQHLFLGTGSDFDTVASLVAYGSGTLLVEENIGHLAFSGAAESDVQVASRYSGSGVADGLTCIVQQRGNGSSSFGVDAHRFVAMPAGKFVTRNASCGAVTITHTGLAVLGQGTYFSLSASPNLQGFAIGFPMPATPIGPCPGCYLGVANASVLLGSSYGILIPSDPILIGFQFAVQGLEFSAAAPCLGLIHFSDVVDVTVH